MNEFKAPKKGNSMPEHIQKRDNAKLKTINFKTIRFKWVQYLFLQHSQFLYEYDNLLQHLFFSIFRLKF